jgi:hypothetical protein
LSTNTPPGARRVALDAPALGVARGRGHPRGPHRRGVGERRVPVHPLQPHRVVGHGLRQPLVRGEARVAPVVLVPPAADDPLPLGRRAGARGHARHHLVERARAGEVDVAQRQAEAEEVAVRVDEPGEHGAAGEVDDARRRPRSAIAPAESPTNARRSPRTASAWASGRAASAVRMRALTTTRSAGGTAAGAGCAPAGPRGASAARASTPAAAAARARREKGMRRM